MNEDLIREIKNIILKLEKLETLYQDYPIEIHFSIDELNYAIQKIKGE